MLHSAPYSLRFFSLGCPTLQHQSILPHLVPSVRTLEPSTFFVNATPTHPVMPNPPPPPTRLSLRPFPIYPSSLRTLVSIH